MTFIFSYIFYTSALNISFSTSTSELSIYCKFCCFPRARWLLRMLLERALSRWSKTLLFWDGPMGCCRLDPNFFAPMLALWSPSPPFLGHPFVTPLWTPPPFCFGIPANCPLTCWSCLTCMWLGYMAATGFRCPDCNRLPACRDPFLCCCYCWRRWLWADCIFF